MLKNARVNRSLATSVVAVMGTLLVASAANATVLLDQNFESTSPVDIANGATVAGFTARTDAAGQAQIVTANSNNFLQLTDTSTADGMPRAFAVFSKTLSTTAAGENSMAGSFDICMPTAVSGTSLPTLIIGIGNAETTGGAVTAIQLSISGKSNGTYTISYTNGSGANAGTAKSATLSASVWYRIELTADFSSTVQDKFGIKVYSVNNPGVSLLEDTNVNTRAANIAVNQITFMDGSNGTDYNSANPLAQIDNVNFTSAAAPVPEASALSLLVPAILALSLKKR